MASAFQVRAAAVWAAALGVLAFSASGAKMTHAQYGGDPYRTFTDQMVLDHMNSRRYADRINAKNKHSAKHSGGKSHATKSARSAKAAPKRATVAAKPVGTLALAQDMFSHFGDDTNKWTLVARLTPQNGGAVLLRPLPLKGERSVRIENVPPGRYTLTLARQKPGGGTEPVQVGTECGEPTNPNGGNFGPSLPVTFALTKDCMVVPLSKPRSRCGFARKTARFTSWRLNSVSSRAAKCLSENGEPAGRDRDLNRAAVAGFGRTDFGGIAGIQAPKRAASLHAPPA